MRRARAAPAAVALSAAAPGTPTNVYLAGEVLHWTVPSTNSPAYVVQTRVGGGAWTDTLHIPFGYKTVGGDISFVVPGTATRDVRVFAHSRGGDSPPSATLTHKAGDGSPATKLINSMTTPPSTARQQSIRDVFTAIGPTILAKLDALHVYAAHDEQAAKLNWVDPTKYLASLGSDPATFAAERIRARQTPTGTSILASTRPRPPVRSSCKTARLSRSGRSRQLNRTLRMRAGLSARAA